MSFGRNFGEIVALAVEFKDTYGMTPGLKEVFELLGSYYHPGYGTIDPTNQRTAEILACNSTTFYDLVPVGEELQAYRHHQTLAVGMILRIFLDRGALNVTDRNRRVFDQTIQQILVADDTEILVTELVVQKALRYGEEHA